jgi:hypothetical protein
LPENLPKLVKKTINSYVINHKEEHKPLDLAGDGWKKIYLDEIVTPSVEGLNTPKMSNINDLGQRLIGMDDEISKCLSNNFMLQYLKKYNKQRPWNKANNL